MDLVQEIGKRLGVLASTSAQDRYMVNATKDEYLLPAEAICDASDVVASLEGHSPLSTLSAMDEQTRLAVSQFALVWRAEECNIDSLLDAPWDELILRNNSWSTLRAAAQQCLSDIGFDLVQWERDHGYAA
jgi:hypothetical protein